MCMCICVSVHGYVCLYKYVYMYMCVYVCIYLYMHIYIYIYIGGIVSTPRIWQPLMMSTIFRHLRYKKKSLVSTTFNLPCYTLAPKKEKSYENRRSNPWAYTPTKTHKHTSINKSPLPTKSMQIFIPVTRGQFHRNIHLPIQQKHDTQPLQSQ